MNSPLNYLGGKSRLAKHIMKLIPEHHYYCEPFCGAAWVFFSKEPSSLEVINDLDGELVIFWRVIQNHLDEFFRYMRFVVRSREIFELEKRKDPTTLTDIQRAVRYFYLQKNCFGGLTARRTFGTVATSSSLFNLMNLEDRLLSVHWRLNKVTIESLPACECIKRYDRPTSFFYLDPPYYGTAGYAVPFGADDYQTLRSTLDDLKGKFILSLNDVPEVRRIFKGFRFKSVSLRYSAGNGRSNPSSRQTLRKEVLIHNL